MQSATLSIGGYPICGVVGAGGELVMSVQECWQSYCNHVHKLAEHRPVCVLDAVQWTLNGSVIDNPAAWFLRITT